jgi:hypothetical protein
MASPDFTRDGWSHPGFTPPTGAAAPPTPTHPEPPATLEPGHLSAVVREILAILQHAAAVVPALSGLAQRLHLLNTSVNPPPLPLGPPQKFDPVTGQAIPLEPPPDAIPPGQAPTVPMSPGTPANFTRDGWQGQQPPPPAG